VSVRWAWLPLAAMAAGVACGDGNSSSSPAQSSGSDDGGLSADGGDTAADAATHDSPTQDVAAADVTGHDGAGGSDAGHDSSSCVDSCPAPNGGVPFGCEKRFVYGVNYAWKNWAADFGGVSAWSSPGVSGNKAAVLADLQDMQSHGVDVVRWWMFEQLEGEAVTFDANGNPTGLGGTAVADIQAALDLAAQVGIHYNFTLFSFDDFDPSGDVNGATRHGMNPIVTDPNKLAQLIANVVVPVAQTVAASPHADRVVSWDVINEPDWAISDSDPYGDPAFSPNGTLQTVTFAQMEAFVKAAVTALHQNSSALVTVGDSAIKWAHAWSHVNLDYYTFHLYDWVQQYYPYTTPPSGYGITGIPVVMGEFPLAGLTGIPYATLVGGLWSEGYAGAMAWAVDDTCCGSWSTAKTDVAAFATSHTCETHY
jgi:hypothetical protein